MKTIAYLIHVSAAVTGDVTYKLRHITRSIKPKKQCSDCVSKLFMLITLAKIDDEWSRYERHKNQFSCFSISTIINLIKEKSHFTHVLAIFIYFSSKLILILEFVGLYCHTRFDAAPANKNKKANKRSPFKAKNRWVCQQKHVIIEINSINFNFKWIFFFFCKYIRTDGSQCPLVTQRSVYTIG